MGHGRSRDEDRWHENAKSTACEIAVRRHTWTSRDVREKARDRMFNSTCTNIIVSIYLHMRSIWILEVSLNRKRYFRKTIISDRGVWSENTCSRLKSDSAYGKSARAAELYSDSFLLSKNASRVSNDTYARRSSSSGDSFVSRWVGIVDSSTCTNEDVKTFIRGWICIVFRTYWKRHEREDLSSPCRFVRNRMSRINSRFPFLYESFRIKLHFFSKGVYNFGVEVLAFNSSNRCRTSRSPWYQVALSFAVRNEVTKLANRSRNASRRVYNPRIFVCSFFFLEKTLTIGLILFSRASSRIVIIYNNNNKILFAYFFFSPCLACLASFFLRLF